MIIFISIFRKLIGRACGFSAHTIKPLKSEPEMLLRLWDVYLCDERVRSLYGISLFVRGRCSLIAKARGGSGRSEGRDRLRLRCDREDVRCAGGDGSARGVEEPLHAPARVGDGVSEPARSPVYIGHATRDDGDLRSEARARRKRGGVASATRRRPRQHHQHADAGRTEGVGDGEPQRVLPRRQAPRRHQRGDRVGRGAAAATAMGICICIC